MVRSIRLVGSTDCVVDPNGNLVADVRFWVGTSGAVVLTPPGSDSEYLYVYYVVEASPYWVLGGKLGTGYAKDLDARLSNVGFSAGVHLRRIELAVLLAAFDAPADWTDETTWCDLPNTAGTIEGEVRGQVLIYTVQDFSAGLDDIVTSHPDPAGDISLKLADPAPVMVGGQLVLFATYLVDPFNLPLGAPIENMVEPGAMAAVWCAVAVDATADDYGKVFTVRWDAVARTSPDIVAHDSTEAADGTFTQYLDPDPVTDGSGAWYVHIGNQDILGGDVGYLSRHVGEESDLTRDPLDPTIPA